MKHLEHGKFDVGLLCLLLASMVMAWLAAIGALDVADRLIQSPIFHH